jgi:hypothetical protein
MTDGCTVPAIAKADELVAKALDNMADVMGTFENNGDLERCAVGEIGKKARNALAMMAMSVIRVETAGNLQEGDSEQVAVTLAAYSLLLGGIILGRELEAIESFAEEGQ